MGGGVGVGTGDWSYPDSTAADGLFAFGDILNDNLNNTCYESVNSMCLLYQLLFPNSQSHPRSRINLVDELTRQSSSHTITQL